MTEVRVPALILRSYRSLSWWTRTAATTSAWAFPVLVFVASTFSPTLSWLIGTAAPLASSTPVPEVKLSPPQDVSASSASVCSAVSPAPSPAASAPAPAASTALSAPSAAILARSARPQPHQSAGPGQPAARSPQSAPPPRPPAQPAPAPWHARLSPCPPSPPHAPPP